MWSPWPSSPLSQSLLAHGRGQLLLILPSLSRFFASHISLDLLPLLVVLQPPPRPTVLPSRSRGNDPMLAASLRCDCLKLRTSRSNNAVQLFADFPAPHPTMCRHLPNGCHRSAKQSHTVSEFFHHTQSHNSFPITREVSLSTTRAERSMEVHKLILFFRHSLLQVEVASQEKMLAPTPLASLNTDRM